MMAAPQTFMELFVDLCASSIHKLEIHFLAMDSYIISIEAVQLDLNIKV